MPSSTTRGLQACNPRDEQDSSSGRQCAHGARASRTPSAVRRVQRLSISPTLDPGDRQAESHGTSNDPEFLLFPTRKKLPKAVGNV